ncbi:transposase [Streptomyces sp. NBC_00648]|uniref:transposase n=1 Tax=Streptomyces sp. NBC_00648 TaxID=2975797 RepID=UPI00386A5209
MVDDDLWMLIEPLMPPWPERSPGPRPVADRLCLQGILYVLYNDIAWQLLPLELGFGSGRTCWRHLERWQQAGVFDRLHRILLAELNAAGELDWSRACVDGSHIRAKYDSNPHREELRKRRILPVISRRGAPNIKGLGKLRYVVEQTFALLHQFKRLAVRWERRTELHDAFVSLACGLICWRRLKKHRS